MFVGSVYVYIKINVFIKLSGISNFFMFAVIQYRINSPFTNIEYSYSTGNVNSKIFTPYRIAMQITQLFNSQNGIYVNLKKLQRNNLLASRTNN